jgi:type VI protein secretion system component VasK
MAMVIIISIAVPMLQAVLSLTGGRQDDELSALAFVAVMVLLLVSWRWLGRMLQNHITTRPASDRQLRSAIRAGEELLARFRQGREAPPRLYTRIWNMGILQVAAGLLATLYVGDLVARLFVR